MIVSLNMPASADSILDARLRGDVPNTMYDVKHRVHWLRHRALDRNGVPPCATGSCLFVEYCEVNGHGAVVIYIGILEVSCV